MARPVVSAAAMAQNWLNGMMGASAKYAAATGAVTESPMAKAATADAQQKYVQNTAAAVASGRMAQKLNAVTLGDWQAACKAKAGNLGQGAQLKKQKYINVSQTLQSAAQSVRDTVASMPKGGSANAAARSAAAVSIMKKAFNKND
jgi:hypothetical protein